MSAGGAIDRVLDLSQVPADSPVLALEGVERELAVAPNREQQVVEVVRNAPGELPDRLHLLSLAELLFGRVERFLRPSLGTEAADEARRGAPEDWEQRRKQGGERHEEDDRQRDDLITDAGRDGPVVLVQLESAHPDPAQPYRHVDLEHLRVRPRAALVVEVGHVLDGLAAVRLHGLVGLRPGSDQAVVVGIGHAPVGRIELDPQGAVPEHLT